MEGLAARAHMSPSTSASTSAPGGLVGYESPSQFSREYSRLFGEPPPANIKRMRPLIGIGSAECPLLADSSHLVSARRQVATNDCYRPV